MSKILDFSKKAYIVIFLSSGVARQHVKALDDLIALLLHGFSNLRGGPCGRVGKVAVFQRS